MASPKIRTKKLDLCRKCGKMFLMTRSTGVCPNCGPRKRKPPQEMSAQPKSSDVKMMVMASDEDKKETRKRRYNSWIPCDSTYPLFKCIPQILEWEVYKHLHAVIGIQLKGKSPFEFYQRAEAEESSNDPQITMRNTFIGVFLFFLLVNEILFDLYCDYKNCDSTFKSRHQIENKIRLIYEKYFNFISLRVNRFERNVSQLARKLRKGRIKIEKIKRIPRVSEPVEITLDIRYAIIKRANSKCEGCGASIFDRSIDVYQIKKDEQGIMPFIAYCDTCREQNNERIVSVQNE